MIGTFVLLIAVTAQAHPPDDLGLLEKAYAARNTPEASRWKQEVEHRLPEIASTFDSVLSHQPGQEAIRFAIPYAYFLQIGNHPEEALEVLTRALGNPGTGASTHVRATALYNAGLLAFRLDEEPKSRAFNEESLRIARQLDDHPAEASALIGLSRIALRHHEYETVIANANRAATLRRSAGDERAAVAAMHMVAAAEKMSGGDRHAQEIYESTLASFQSAGDIRGVASERYNLGYVHLHLGQVEQATHLFDEALSQYAKTKDETYVAFCLTGLAAVAAVHKQSARAAQLYGAAATTLERLGVKLDPDDQLDWDRYTAIARRDLPDQYETEFQRGRRLTIDEAIALARQ